MELIRKKRVPFAKITIGGRGGLSHDLQLYVHPPTSTIQLSEMYDLAIERMKVLRIFEQIVPSVPSNNLDDKISAVLLELQKQGFAMYAKLLISSGEDQSEAGANDRLKDNISHFILRLPFCQSEDLRSWFLARELELFCFRFHSLNMQGVRSFLESNHLHYSPISEEEKSSVLSNLLRSTANMTHAEVETSDFYKVPFIEVPDLIGTIKVYLSKGNAYIPSRDMLSVVSPIFKHNLYEGLQLAAYHIIDLMKDERLKPLINLHKLDSAETQDFSEVEDGVTPEKLDPLSRVSFPPCMRQLHESIRNTHHAKHGTRIQYGLFLKGIGLSLEDSVQFWREEFTKSMTPVEFQSHYLYTIRHNYGQEGKQVSYSPYCCMSIINSPVGAEDCHGCPFKHNSNGVMRQQLENYGISLLGVQAIMDFVSQHQYQLACTKYFELTHPSAPIEVIQHPNDFFELSRMILTGGEVPSRKNFEMSGRHIKTEKFTPSGPDAVNISEVSSGNDSLRDAIDIDVSHLVEEAGQTVMIETNETS